MEILGSHRTPKNPRTSAAPEVPWGPRGGVGAPSVGAGLAQWHPAWQGSRAPVGPSRVAPSRVLPSGEAP